MASGPGGLHTDVIHRPGTEPGTVFRTSPGHLRFPVSLDGLERCSDPRRDCQKTFGFPLWGGQCPFPQGWQTGCVHLPKPGNQPVTRRVRLAGCRWGTGNQPFFPVENRRRSRRKQRRNPNLCPNGDFPPQGESWRLFCRRLTPSTQVSISSYKQFCFLPSS